MTTGRNCWAVCGLYGLSSNLYSDPTLVISSQSIILSVFVTSEYWPQIRIFLWPFILSLRACLSAFVVTEELQNWEKVDGLWISYIEDDHFFDEIYRMGGGRSWYAWRYCPNIRLEGLRKSIAKLRIVAAFGNLLAKIAKNGEKVVLNYFSFKVMFFS
jgi:hypothetical protein